MSELKAFNSERIYSAVEQVKRVAGDIDTLHLDDSQFYLKSEADKVIAELEMKLAAAKLVLRLNEPKALYSNLDTMSRLNHKIDVVERRELHQKYKRCLAMAGWCEATALWCYQAANTLPTGFHATLFGKPVMIEPDRLFDRFELLMKWSNRWMKIAKKFKPIDKTKELKQCQK